MMLYHRTFSHSTKPPNMLRDAEPEPLRAKRDSSLSDQPNCNASLHADAKAAYALADEAKPAAVGTKFSLSI